MDDSFICIRETVLFRIFFFEFQSEIDLISSGTQMPQKNYPHKTVLPLLPTVENGGPHGSLGASITADESNKPEGESHGFPSSVVLRAMAAVTTRATWFKLGEYLLPLFHGSLSPLPPSLMALFLGDF